VQDDAISNAAAATVVSLLLLLPLLPGVQFDVIPAKCVQHDAVTQPGCAAAVVGGNI
jgi:hypothetical protein